MSANLPWAVSPEFEDALVLATQRHQQQLSVPRSSSLMMKTRVAVRDKTPHRFQVVPLRDTTKPAANRRDKPANKHPPVPWTRQFAAVRLSGVGLGLNVVSQQNPTPCAPRRRGCSWGPEGGRGRSRPTDVFGGGRAASPAPSQGIWKGLQASSPKRPIGSPDKKENMLLDTPTKRRRQPLKGGRSFSVDRRREYCIDAPDVCVNSTNALDDERQPDFSGFDTIIAHSMPTEDDITMTMNNTPAHMALPSSNTAMTFSSTFLFPDANTPKTIPAPGVPPSTRSLMPKRSSCASHVKSPSLGTIHHLLSSISSASVTDLPKAIASTPRVRCRKRTNTLSADITRPSPAADATNATMNTKRYGIYTLGKLDFSPVAPPDARPLSLNALPSAGSLAAHPSACSLAALISSYARPSQESLPSLYSQESFVGEHGWLGGVSRTRPLRVQLSSRAQRPQSMGDGRPHAIWL
ncbi:hypothetical protein B0H10DRAFT_2150631 [Mycena sp. CBHHK59/15]|nr:hypothetical protein B0H10DRAFT_2150631 [Mycena sp. CBHHK59/15]